jgi:fused signal recognition particle receptor
VVFNFLKKTFQKIYTQVASPIRALFARPIDQETLKELETILLTADTGIRTTRFVLDAVTQAWQNGTLKDGQDLKSLLEETLNKMLATPTYQAQDTIYLMVGINGSGKTTAISKLANLYKKEGKRVLCVAADTFRAAATEQLASWAHKIGTDIIVGKESQDPSSVVYAGVQEFKKGAHDVLIIDTAGRLQTKIHLMKELEKIKRVISAQLPNRNIVTLLTIDAMLGQNSFEQAKLFHESTPIDGVILTKMDGTGKGGIVFAIIHELHIPIAYVSFGEQPDQFKLFDAQEYVHDLLN